MNADITTDDVLARALEISEMRFDDDFDYIAEDCYECCGRGWVDAAHRLGESYRCHARCPRCRASGKERVRW